MNINFKIRKSRTILHMIIITVLMFIVPFIELAIKTREIYILIIILIVIIIGLMKYGFTNKVTLKDKYMLVPKKNIDNKENIEGKINIIDNRLKINYDDIENVIYENNMDIYIKNKNLKENISLSIYDHKEFIEFLKEKNIDIINVNEETTKFENHIFSNKYFIMAVLPFFILLFIGSIVNLSITFFVENILISYIWIYFIIYYKIYICIGKDSIIIQNKFGDIKLSNKQLLFEDIKKVRKNKWGLEIKLKGYTYKIITNEKEKLYNELNNSLN